MPTIPKQVTLTNSSVDVLNAIRNSATQNYRDNVPIATADASSIRDIGAIIMDYPALQNEFVSALINRIGRTLITSKLYSNPWAMFKRGFIEFGESIEEIFVEIASVKDYDLQNGGDVVDKYTQPDVRAAFHVLNYKKYYPDSIAQAELQRAFLSWDGVNSLIAGIVNSMYTAAAYDEFQTMKYMLARHMIVGQLYPQQIPVVTEDNMRTVVSNIKSVSNQLTFMSDNYNLAGVRTFSTHDDQFIIINADFDATMSVEVLATSFNMTQAEFMGHRVLIDGFGKLDTDRLNELFSGQEWYEAIDNDTLQALNTIPAVLVDRNYFMIFDNLDQFTERYVESNLSWNYFYHVWKTFSVSPFSNAIMFIPDTPGVTSVSVTPATATAGVGQQVQLTAEVTTTNFAPQSVTWSVTNTTGTAAATVTSSGLVTITAGVATNTVTVTATSTFDATKKGTCVITLE